MRVERVGMIGLTLLHLHSLLRLGERGGRGERERGAEHGFGRFNWKWCRKVNQRQIIK